MRVHYSKKGEPQAILALLQKNPLTYLFHEIAAPSPFTGPMEISVPREAFRHEIRMLRGQTIHFDDGYRSILEVLPILEEFEITAVLYLNLQGLEDGLLWLNKLSYLLSQNPSLPPFFNHINTFRYPESVKQIEEQFLKYGIQDSLPRLFLTVDEARKLSRHPLIRIGSHTRHHYPLHRLPPEILRAEIVDHHYELKATLGCKLEGFAIPFGLGDELSSETVELIAEIDTQLVTVLGNSESHRRFALPESPRLPFEKLGMLLSHSITSPDAL